MPAPAPAPAPAAAPSPAAQEISVRVGRVQGSGFEIFWLFVLEFPRAGLSLDRLRDEKLRLVGFQSILRGEHCDVDDYQVSEFRNPTPSYGSLKKWRKVSERSLPKYAILLNLKPKTLEPKQPDLAHPG